MRNAPGQPHTGGRSLPPFVCHKKHFSRTAYKARLQLKQRRSAAVCLWIQHLKSLLPPDVSPLLVELLEELPDAFVGVHVFLAGRDEQSQQSTTEPACQLNTG